MPVAIRGADHKDFEMHGPLSMKYMLRTDHQAPRRPPVPERQTDKGHKHESFDFSRLGFDQRSMALAQRMDRKR